ncbi:unnamed protein product [Musa acuminata subsp. malaccensis]|uniref:(wild Malaysian banana) hypothetical protein n=1 Tax=Musa acuminata subsp. malaccensis TaxID=214687 RepID=A0A8D7FDS0_MUSAM|nr:unnamed protein product [Musa acuminata subsp. malaccensis]
MAARNGRWQPPPAPTILNLPRLPRRSRAAAPRNPGLDRNVGDLPDRERSARPPPPPPPPPPPQVMMVEAEATSAGESRGDSGGEERWRFQAEILRAECNFLRMEREVALRKLERNRTEMEIALKSAMETLVSGRKKIDGCGSVGTALDEEIEELEEKLEELKLGNSNRRKRSTGSSRKLLRGSWGGDFDRRAFMLRRQLKKMEEDTSVKDIQEISVQAFANKGPEAERHQPEDHDMEKLRKKMEGMSKGMLERMEECSYLLSAKSSTITTTTTTKSELNCSSQQTTGITEAADMAHSPILQIQQQQQQEKLVEEKMGLLSCCSCKEVVGRIVQQVRAETEQWSEMQQMLEQVRVEMEELRSSRDHWHRRAIASEINFHSQHTQKLEWKQRARSSERKVIELQKLSKELQPRRTKLLNAPSSSSPLQSDLQLPADPRRAVRSHDSYNEKEKHVLVCHLKSQHNSSRRSPLQVIDNISPLLRPRR